MKRILMLLLIVFGCVTSGMAQDELFEKELKKAQRGNAKSQFYVATYYEKGKGCTQDYDKALYWYVECVKNGDYNDRYYNNFYMNERKDENLAAWAICDCFKYVGRVELKNPSSAFQMVDDAVKKTGSYILKKLLADWYYDGFGIEKDYVQAMKLYEEIYSKYHYDFGPCAFDQMAKCYSEGLGTRVDYKKALKYGCFLFDEDGVFKIYQKSDRYDKEINDLLFEYFSKRVDGYIRTWIGNAARGWGDNGIYMNGKFYGRDEKTYANNSSFNAYNCSPYAAYCYGNAYETGRNVPVDIKQAKLYYAFAIKRAESARYPNQYNEVKQLAQQALDRLNGNGIRPPQPGNLPNITFLSPSSSSSTSYNLKACIKSSSQISGVKVTLNGSMVLNRTRGFDPVPNDGCAYTIDQALTLKNGFRNEIIVSITNSKGTKTDTLYVSVEGSPTPPQSKEKRIALVMGIENYQHVRPLINPVNDANAMEAKLRQCGFYVIKRNNLKTALEVRNAINDFGAQARNGYDVALFFYAGHGINYNNESWIVPTNASIQCLEQIPNVCANAGWIMDATSGVKNRIVIFDACRDLPPTIKDCRNTNRDIEDHIPGITSFKKGGGAFVAYACSPGETSGDGPIGGNGIYTGELLKMLDRPNMNILDVFSETATNVHNKTNAKQNPWNTSAFYGKFIFNKR